MKGTLHMSKMRISDTAAVKLASAMSSVTAELFLLINRRMDRHDKYHDTAHARFIHFLMGPEYTYRLMACRELVDTLLKMRYPCGSLVAAELMALRIWAEYEVHVKNETSLIPPSDFE